MKEDDEVKYRVSCIIEDEKLIGPLVTVLATHGKVTVEAERSAAEIIHSLHPPAKGKSAPAVTVHKAATEPVRRQKKKYATDYMPGAATNLALQTLASGPRSARQIAKVFKEHKRPQNGVGPALANLNIKGMAKRSAEGGWELTAKGKDEADRQIAKPRNASFADHEGQAEARTDA